MLFGTLLWGSDRFTFPPLSKCELCSHHFLCARLILHYTGSSVVSTAAYLDITFMERFNCFWRVASLLFALLRKYVPAIYVLPHKTRKKKNQHQALQRSLYTVSRNQRTQTSRRKRPVADCLSTPHTLHGHHGGNGTLTKKLVWLSVSISWYNLPPNPPVAPMPWALAGNPPALQETTHVQLPSAPIVPCPGVASGLPAGGGCSPCAGGASVFWAGGASLL